MDPVQEKKGLSDSDREWRRQRLLEANREVEQLPYRKDREAKRRVRLAEMIYASSLEGENLRMWPTAALKELAIDCARAALAMNDAECLIFANYAARQSRKSGGAT